MESEIKVYIEGQIDAIYEKAKKKSFSDYEECYSDGNARLVTLEVLKDIIDEVKNEGSSISFDSNILSK